jgi:ribokinase
MSRVIVVGSANTDLTVKAQCLPRSGETVTGDELMVSYGGKGANQALAALKAGAEVTFLAKIGTDPYGNLLYDHLVRSGLAPEGLIRDPREPAGLALIAVDKTGNNQIMVIPGSNGRFMVEDFRPLEPLLQTGSLFLIQLEIPLPTVEYALRLARSRGMTTILDPAPVCPLPPAVYSAVDILTPNEIEAGSLTDMVVHTPSQAEKAASVLISRGCQMVIVTLGARGALLSRAEGVEFFAALPTSPVDTVAAGDAFNGGLAAALASSKPLSQAIRFASAAGALSTTRRGAQESLPTRREIEHLLAEQGTGTGEK